MNGGMDVFYIIVGIGILLQEKRVLHCADLGAHLLLTT
jgi:hypothetical protein